MSSQNLLIAECVVLLEQGANLLSKIDDQLFATTTPISPRGSIGGHLRHILDFYQSFLRGLKSQRVDYNQRERNTLIETQRVHALAKIQLAIVQMREVSEIDMNQHLLVSAESASVWCRSSVSREIEFLRSHTIHHYSLIAMLLRLHEIDPGEEFGVAPSTIKHWKQELECAQ